MLHVKLENAYSRPKMFLGRVTPKMESSFNATPKRHILVQKHVI